MNRLEIMAAVQQKLVGDVAEVVEDVEEEYGNKLTNSWVFDYIEDSLENFSPVDVEAVENMSRKEVESQLKEKIDEALPDIKKHMPEIDIKDIYCLIPGFGRMYDLISRRTDLELKGLEKLTHHYSHAEALVNNEYAFTKAFDSEEEHRKWVQDFSKELDNVLEHARYLGEISAEDRGAIRRKHLQNKIRLKFGIKLRIKDLPEDIDLARKAILDSYGAYEEGLIQTRYGA